MSASIPMKHRIIVALCIAMSASAHAQNLEKAQTWNAAKQPLVVTPHATLLYRVEKGTESIVTIDKDGRVSFGKGMTADEASREFWRLVGREAARTQACQCVSARANSGANSVRNERQ